MKAFFHPDQSLHDPKQFMRVGKISDPQDVPARTEKLLAGLAAAGISPKTPADAGIEPVERIHASEYVDFLKSAYKRWVEIDGAGPEVLPNVFPYWNGSPARDHREACRPTSVVAQAGFYLGDLAVPIGENTWRSCLVSAHSAVAAAAAVMGADRFAYALCRPSGHHARSDRASGFCYLNNSAIAAQHLKQSFNKIAVIDVDTHHGDGTQAIFYRRTDILTVSLHGDPENYYPFYTGYKDERGFGEGEGFNINVPLPAGTGDTAFLSALERTLEQVAKFKPEALVIALGYDIHTNDPIGIFDVSTGAFSQIGKQIAGLGLPAVIVQEGGYQVSVIGDCLYEFLSGVSS